MKIIGKIGLPKEGGVYTIDFPINGKILSIAQKEDGPYLYVYGDFDSTKQTTIYCMPTGTSFNLEDEVNFEYFGTAVVQSYYIELVWHYYIEKEAPDEQG